MVPAGLAVPLPSRASMELGATMGVPALTAHRCVFADGPVAGQTVLVQGGAGAVGHYAIELAKWGGAQVVTTVSDPTGPAAVASGGGQWSDEGSAV